MASLTGDTTVIHRLTIKAERACQTKAAAVRAQLQGGDWPQAGRGEWVFIRRLHAKATARQLPGRLLQETRAVMQSGDSGLVVRFANLAELLAALALDLSTGSAEIPWYWRRWQHWFALPQGRRFAALASDHPDELAAVTSALARSDALTGVWQSIAPAQAGNLVVALAARAGVRLLPTVPATGSTDVDRTSGSAPAGGDPESWVPAQAIPLQVPQALLARWQPIVAALPADDARTRLAALLLALEAAPLRLHTNPEACIAGIVQVLTGATARHASSRSQSHPLAPATRQDALAGEAPIPEQPASRRLNDGETGWQRASVSKQRDEVGPRPPTPSNPTHRPATNVRPSAQADDVGAVANRQPANDTPEQGAEDNSLDALAESEAPAMLPDCDSFSTEQGGLLYLLNMLNRPEMRRLMLAHAESLPNAWIWLYRLGQQLDLRDDDPLIDYIAVQLGCRSRAELARLPPLPDSAQVLDLAWRWYGKAEVWHPALLHLPAQIYYTSSHLDLYAAMSAIRLPVRLAGLDVDPGWLPWLGKVVAFHYD
ncbi:hypothetical protein [Methylomonas sp. HYX-M1]|uniref:hypothetical protein n=1 Tax=Methylomonas sp. HYX-M1 TaxID=3139307 RepID=UPI00345C17B6